MDNKNRAGFFTSSQMSRLTASLKNGKPSSAFKTYIEEVALEIMMGRVVNTEVKTQAMKWGSLMEVELFNLIGLGYRMSHKETIKHHKYGKTWSGTPDLISPKIIGEIKCFQPKNFSKLSLCILKKNVEKFKEDFPKEYWQCVSNAMLCKVKKAEIITYMPYKLELEKIIKKIEETDFLIDNGLDPLDYYFLTKQNIESLPYLPDDSKMSNINTFEFDIPTEDIIFLTKRVIEAEKEVELLLESYV